MMKLHNLLIIFSIAVLSVSCRDDNGPFAEEVVNYDIVTLSRQDDESGSTFTAYRPDSDLPIIYRDSRAVIDLKKVAVGERLLLGYIADNGPYVDGNIRATGYSPIYNDTLKIYTKELIDTTDWRRDPIYVYSIWRAGAYLNVHGRATYTDKSAIFRLGIIDSDLNDRTTLPQLYLIYRMSDPVDNFESDFYASFDISKLWDNEWCNGFEVLVENTNLKQDIFNFTK